MEFNNIKFIKNVLKGSQVKHVIIKKNIPDLLFKEDLSTITITLKNKSYILIIFEKKHYIDSDGVIIESKKCSIEIFNKNCQNLANVQVFHKGEQDTIIRYLNDYVKSL